MDNRKLGKERGTQGKNTMDNRVGRFVLFFINVTLVHIGKGYWANIKPCET